MACTNASLPAAFTAFTYDATSTPSSCASRAGRLDGGRPRHLVLVDAEPQHRPLGDQADAVGAEDVAALRGDRGGVERLAPGSDGSTTSSLPRDLPLPAVGAELQRRVVV